jgi:hypothetical protein
MTFLNNLSASGWLYLIFCNKILCSAVLLLYIYKEVCINSEQMAHVMKKLLSVGVAVFTLSVFCVSVSSAQKVDELTKQAAFSGPIIKKKDPSEGANLGNLFNMKMSQSFSANIGTMGGHVMNTDIFTNSMHFFFTPKLTGQLDVSLLTSPFGMNTNYGFNKANNGFNNKLQVALDAQLNYQLTDHMDLHLRVTKMPDGYGYYPGYYGYGRYGTAPFAYGPIFGR